jgi:hypothetical protein
MLSIYKLRILPRNIWEVFLYSEKSEDFLRSTKSQDRLSTPAMSSAEKVIVDLIKLLICLLLITIGY